MNEISQKEIAYLKQFMVRHYVRYEDVQLELIDHMASGIEEKLEANPEMDFETALKEVYRGFGKLGFSQIIKEKEKAMQKFWQNHILKLFFDFLKPPLIFLSIFIFSTTFFLQSEFGFNFWSTYATTTIIIIFCLVIICFKAYTKEEDINKYLYLKSYYGISASFLFMFGYLTPTTFLDFSNTEPIELTIPVIWFTSFYFTLFLISLYIFIYKIPNGLLKKFHQQYQKYSIA